MKKQYAQGQCAELTTGRRGIKTVSGVLVHTQVTTSLNFYAHNLAAAQANAADAIVEIPSLLPDR